MAITYRYAADEASATPNADLYQRDIDDTLHMVEWNQAILQRTLRFGPKMKDRKSVWLADSDAEPTAVGAINDGAALSAFSFTSTEPVVLSNGVHYDGEAIGLTDLDREFVSIYGDTWDYQEAKTMRKLVKRFDVNLLHSTYVAGVAGSTEPKMAGLVQWALSAASRNAGDTLAIAGSPAIPVTLLASGQQQATGSPVTDTVFNTFLGVMKNRGVDVSRLLCMTGIAGKTRASAFLRVYDVGSGTQIPLYQYHRSLAEKTAGMVVDWYENDWGVVGFLVNKYMNSSFTDSTSGNAVTGTVNDMTFSGEDAYIFFDPTTLSILPAQGYATKRMGTDGLREAAIISAAMTLKVNNPRDIGIITNIDGS